MHLRRNVFLIFIRSGGGLSLLPADTLVGGGEDAMSFVDRLRVLGIEVLLSSAYFVMANDKGVRLHVICLGDIVDVAQPLPSGLALLAPNEIPIDKLGCFHGLVQRFLRERAQDVFGLSAGTAEKGILDRLPQPRGA
ncbi:hypothetical protein [Microvirga massiliensis]|uniref:hypothetical protein n=1 Tax=Microvirga massiliensis TaxID=1033741 RepID=UPI00062B361F|nr:hypothetical protein [Microvirga massiliensis]